MMILRLADEEHPDDPATNREVWLRDKRHLILPEWFPQNTTFLLSTLRVNRLYLSEHREDVIPLIRQNMGLRREQFHPLQRIFQIALGLMTMGLGLNAVAFLASVGVEMSKRLLNQADVFYGFMCGLLTLVMLSLALVGVVAIWRALQPSRSQRVDENVEHLIAKGRLIICEGQIKTYPRRQAILLYKLPPEQGRSVIVEIPFPEYQCLKFQDKEPALTLFVLYVDHTLNVVL